MLNYKTSIKGDITYSDLEIKEIKPIMKLIIRGKTKDFITAVGKNLNMVLPTEANTSTSAEKLTAFWLSPDEWMLISNETVSEESNTYQVEDELIKNISKVKLGAVTDVSDQFVMLNIKGGKVFDLFATGSPFNFNDFKTKKGPVIFCSPVRARAFRKKTRLKSKGLPWPLYVCPSATAGQVRHG